MYCNTDHAHCNRTPLIGVGLVWVYICALDHSLLQLFGNTSTGYSDAPEIGIVNTVVVVCVLATVLEENVR